MGSAKRSIRYLKHKELSYWNLLKDYLSGQELFSIYHILIASILPMIFTFLVVKFNLYSMVEDILAIIISASTDILAVLIAAFGLFAAVTDRTFLDKIYKAGELANVLYPFWFSSSMWVLTLVTGMLFNVLLNINPIGLHWIRAIFFAMLFLFLLSIGYTLALIGDILKLTIYRTQIEIIVQNNHSKKDMFENLKSNEEEIDPKYRHFLNAIRIFGAVIFIYSLCWYYFFFGYQWSFFLAGVFYLAYTFITYKFYLLLKKNDQFLLGRRLKGMVKLLIIMSCGWISIFVM
jgi:hypothetical protein